MNKYLVRVWVEERIWNLRTVWVEADSFSAIQNMDNQEFDLAIHEFEDIIDQEYGDVSEAWDMDSIELDAEHPDNITPSDEKPDVEEGLWKNIHAKRKRMKAGSGEKKAKPGDEDYPETLDVDEAKNKDGKEQGGDGKACWDGKKYAGKDKDGSDICVPMEEAELTERGSPLESNFQHAIMDFIVEQMNSMGLNPGDPMDRDRMKKQVMSIVSTAISALDLDEGAKVKDKYDDEVENKNEKSRKEGIAAYLKEENIAAFVDVVLDEAAAELEEGGRCTKATQKASSTSKNKKWMKCVKNPDGKGYIRKHWGQKGVRATGDSGDTGRKKNFRARHGCADAKPGTSKKLACDDW